MVTTSNIYLITNKLNNKKYVGQSICISERWKRHRIDYKKYTNRYLYRAMNKYGIDSFKFEVIESGIPLKEIHNREIFYIKAFKTRVPLGYNMTDGGEGSINRITSDETKERIRLKMVGKIPSQEARAKMSKAHKNRYKDIEEREKTRQHNLKNTSAIKKATETIKLYNESLSYDEKVSRAKHAVKSRSHKLSAQSLTDNSILHFNSIREASRWVREHTEYSKACHTNISKACRGKLDYVYGYKWVLTN
ncbi:GIY-YIG nuclease family protein [Rossellomorea marisflavi]|uniref:GIY-YIG nuclease family protein n=1 Tax=Rossellomorea marisflavi TaxID=189381 RepID=UPI00345D292A